MTSEQPASTTPRAKKIVIVQNTENNSEYYISLPWDRIQDFLRVINQAGASPQAILTFIQNTKNEFWGVATSEELTNRAGLNKDLYDVMAELDPGTGR